MDSEWVRLIVSVLSGLIDSLCDMSKIVNGTSNTAR